MGTEKTFICAVCGTEMAMDEMSPVGDPEKELPVCIWCIDGGTPVNAAPWMFVLGAPDTEMIAIRDYLTQCDVAWMWGSHQGKVLTPGTSRKVDHPEPHQVTMTERGYKFPVHYMWVECCPEGEKPIFDHHFPGDPGFDKRPDRYWEGSSLGQVWAYLADHGIIHGGFPGPGNVSPKLRIVAAADHCLRAAYAGECPGVDPTDLAEFRVTSRAQHQGRPEHEVRRDIESAISVLRNAPSISLAHRATGYGVKDLRSSGMVPELPEAATRIGTPFLARISNKVVLQAAERHQVNMFMNVWAHEQGLTEIYGNPNRGFAGGYLP